MMPWHSRKHYHIVSSISAYNLIRLSCENFFTLKVGQFLQDLLHLLLIGQSCWCCGGFCYRWSYVISPLLPLLSVSYILQSSEPCLWQAGDQTLCRAARLRHYFVISTLTAFRNQPAFYSVSSLTACINEKRLQFEGFFFMCLCTNRA